jgi:hypothetical protein
MIISRRIRQWKEKDAAKASHPLAWMLSLLGAAMQINAGSSVAAINYLTWKRSFEE